MRRFLQFTLPFLQPPPAPQPPSRPATTRAGIMLEGRLVEYTLRRTRGRRTIAITIDETGVRVGASLTASRRAIEDVLARHGTWVLRKLDAWSERHAPVTEWCDGTVFMVEGNPVRLEIGAAGTEPVLADGVLRLPVARPGDGDAIREAVRVWLRARALAVFTARAAVHAAVLGRPTPRVRLSEARTRWGSCTASGNVRLNWRLIQMPAAWLDYVVAHEIAHLAEMNHSPRFWQTVERLVPDHRALRAALRKDGIRFLIL